MKRKCFVLLPILSSLSLTSCFNITKPISKEKFLEKFNQITSNYEDISNCPKNIHINTKLSVDRYDYKEGEYYSYYMFALIVVVPITSGVYTWKEDGKYYRAETHTDSSKNKYFEISEEQFNSYMESHKQKIWNLIGEPITRVNSLIDITEDDFYKDVKQSYYAHSKGVGFNANAASKNMEDTKYKVTVEFQNLLPLVNKTITYTGNTKSESYYEYHLNEAKFIHPNVDEN